LLPAEAPLMTSFVAFITAGTSAIVEIETIAAVVEAYAQRKIELNGLSEKTPKAVVRYAPSFIPECSPQRGEHSQLSGDRPYTQQSIAKFLGWTQSKSGSPQTKVTLHRSCQDGPLVAGAILTHCYSPTFPAKRGTSLHVIRVEIRAP
jgi:hypothetical protein